jgi:hypothetical protein
MAAIFPPGDIPNAQRDRGEWREFNLALHALLNCLRPVLRLAHIPSRRSRSSHRLRDPPRKRKMQMTVPLLLS